MAVYRPKFSQYEPDKADANSACPGVVIDPSDVELQPDLPELCRTATLRSNVFKKAAQVHALFRYKVWQKRISAVRYIVEFQLGYTPKPDTNATWNPQTIEAACQIYYGSTTGICHTAAIQWEINPWGSRGINIWTPAPDGSATWMRVDDHQIERGKRYRFDIALDLENKLRTQVKLQQRKLFVLWQTLGSWVSYASEKKSDPPDNWGTDDSWWVTVENISASPNCGLGIGFKHENYWYRPYIRTW